MQFDAVAALFNDVETVELTTWVERGWVQPDAAGTAWEFHEIDVARVRLIRTLRRDMDVREDAMPLVLSLLDQVYELRGTVQRLLDAVGKQPSEVQAAVLAALR
ncbi:MAG: chaperone modulator CbpM [Pseudomonadota bacterium]|nr:chaperone modulator CbpM [Pseudomonadota bacterium]